MRQPRGVQPFVFGAKGHDRHGLPLLRLRDGTTRRELDIKVAIRFPSSILRVIEMDEQMPLSYIPSQNPQQLSSKGVKSSAALHSLPICCHGSYILEDRWDVCSRSSLWAGFREPDPLCGFGFCRRQSLSRNWGWAWTNRRRKHRVRTRRAAREAPSKSTVPVSVRAPPTCQ